jgi:GPH family glycoside/pentoside/hexuronide:cation symporter
MLTPPAKPAERQPPLRIDVCYALVTLGSTTIWSVMGGWLLYFYLPPEGTPLVPVTLYSLALFSIRVVDALIAPSIGYLSDHTRSRWGRRLPFMFVAGLPMLVFFVLLWTPPLRGESAWNLVYLVLVLELYSVAYSSHQIPYEALLPELALTDHHRVRVSAWYASFQLIGLILGGLAGLLIDHWGYVTMALIYGAAILPFLYAPFLVLRERPGRQIPVAQQLDFRRSISTTLRNRAFLVFSVTWAFYWSTTMLVQMAIPFIVTQICHLPLADTMYFYLPAVLASLACYPLITWLSDRVGKWRVYSGSLLASALVLPGLALIGDWLPLSLKGQGIAWTIVQAVAMAGAVVLPSAFAAEITDHDEALTGQRREGAYYATWGLLDTVVSGLASALLPLLLSLGHSHTDPHGPLGVRMVGVVCGVWMLVAFFVFLRYPFRQRQLTKYEGTT